MFLLMQYIKLKRFLVNKRLKSSGAFHHLCIVINKKIYKD